MTESEGQVTREQVAAVTEAWAVDPSTVAEVTHHGLNADEECGGYAFACDRGLVIYAFDGGSVWSIDPGSEARRITAIEKFWRDNQRRNRTLRLDAVSEWHRAAIAALTAGLNSVGQLPPEARPGVTDPERADYLYVILRRHVSEQTRSAALKALAANGWLLDIPKENDRAHACPLCGKPAIGEPWQYISVCDACYPMTACSHQRQVSGYNTSIGGGFEAQHVDDKSVCDQVTHDGVVWVFERECHMGEAKFGGIFVGAMPSRPK